MNALQEAQQIFEDRGAAYGTAKKTHARIAEMWSAVLGQEITPAQVALCMILVKAARLTETPDHHDSIVDIAGYAQVYKDCL